MQEQGSGAAVLRIWEVAAAAPTERRGSAIVASAMGQPMAMVEATPVGQRDRNLLELRHSSIGDLIEARDTCPQCAALVEASFAVSDLVTGATETGADTVLEVDGLHLTVRAPTAGDLAKLGQALRDSGGDGHADAHAAHQALLRLCVIRCETADGQPKELPAMAAGAVAAAVEALDPLAAIVFALECPDCGAAFETPFDPPTFVWQELSTLASRLLWEVDQLARAYGWPEADMLALSPMRRRAYLEIAAS